MEDQEILALYWRRSESAIQETDRKYEAYCAHIAMNIRADREDAEECGWGSWRGTWLWTAERGAEPAANDDVGEKMGRQ